MNIIKTIKDAPGLVLSPFIKEEMQNRKQIYRSLKARANQKRTAWERAADYFASIFGSITFLVLNVIWFSVWILVNTGHFFGLRTFDPFPFGFLTMVVSLEAIVLSIIVLISQNRNSRVDDLREEVHLQVNVVAEQEITKIIKLLSVLLEKNGVDISQDKELARMLRPLQAQDLEKDLEKEIGK